MSSKSSYGVLCASLFFFPGKTGRSVNNNNGEITDFTFFSATVIVVCVYLQAFLQGLSVIQVHVGCS